MTDCGHPVVYTVRDAHRELQVCAAHLDWARRELPFGVPIKQTTASGYRIVVSGCRAPKEEAA